MPHGFYKRFIKRDVAFVFITVFAGYRSVFKIKEHYLIFISAAFLAGDKIGTITRFCGYAQLGYRLYNKGRLAFFIQKMKGIENKP